jgi:hypothetical protein
VETSAGAGGQFELWGGTDSQGELLDVNLRRFFQGGGKFRLGPEEVGGGGRVRAAMTLIILRREREMLCGGFAESLRFIEKYDRALGTFCQL